MLIEAPTAYRTAHVYTRCKHICIHTWRELARSWLGEWPAQSGQQRRVERGPYEKNLQGRTLPAVSWTSHLRAYALARCGLGRCSLAFRVRTRARLCDQP